MNESHTSDRMPADDPDEVLVAELRRLGGMADPVPEGWAAAAHTAFAWATTPGVPARLTYDSRSARPEGSSDALFDVPAQRTVRFTAGAGAARVQVDLEVDVGADKLRVVGRVHPGVPTIVVAICTGDRVPVQLDEAGTFRVDELPRRPFCVLVEGPRPVRTGWVVT